MPTITAIDVDLGSVVQSALLIQARGRTIVSIPSQIGCAVRCSFCISSTQRPVRSLSGDEMWRIVGAVKATHDLQDVEVAITGEGEPALNVEGVQAFMQIAARKGGVSSIRVGTSGAKPRNIAHLASADVPTVLQLSVHSTRPEQRKKLIPGSAPWLQVEAEARRAAARFRLIRMNYVVVEDMNDTTEDAKRLADMGEPSWPIILSPTLGDWKPSRRVDAFRAELEGKGRKVHQFATVGAAINKGLYERLTYRPISA